MDDQRNDEETFVCDRCDAEGPESRMHHSGFTGPDGEPHHTWLCQDCFNDVESFGDGREP